MIIVLARHSLHFRDYLVTVVAAAAAAASLFALPVYLSLFFCGVCDKQREGVPPPDQTSGC